MGKIPKKHYLLVALILITFFTFANKVQAAKNKPVYATLDQVQQMIEDALFPIQSSIQSLTGQVDNLDETISPIPEQINNLQNAQSQNDTSFDNINNSLDSLSTRVATVEASVNTALSGFEWVSHRSEIISNET